jgi:hypothetical protein
MIPTGTNKLGSLDSPLVQNRGVLTLNCIWHAQVLGKQFVDSLVYSYPGNLKPPVAKNGRELRLAEGEFMRESITNMNSTTNNSINYDILSNMYIGTRKQFLMKNQTKKSRDTISF